MRFFSRHDNDVFVLIISIDIWEKKIHTNVVNELHHDDDSLAVFSILYALKSEWSIKSNDKHQNYQATNLIYSDSDDPIIWAKF